MKLFRVVRAVVALTIVGSGWALTPRSLASSDPTPDPAGTPASAEKSQADKAKSPPPPARVWNFDSAEKNGPPPDWVVPTTIENAGWKARVVDAPASKASGGAADPAAAPHRCIELRCEPVEGKSAPFGNVMLTLDAAPYRGKQITFSASVLAPPVGAGRAQLWLREDRPEEKVGLFNNMSDRPIISTGDGAEMKTFTITGRVHDDAQTINIGMMVVGGNGPALLDDVTITAAEPLTARFSIPAPLGERALINLEALARVVGYLRHYHPSDQAAAVDWNLLTIDAVIACEPAENAEQLAAAFTKVFAPYAPTARFQSKPFEGKFDPKAMAAQGDHAERVVRWHHIGFGGSTGTTPSIYRSSRVFAAVDDKAPENTPSLGDVIERELPGGVFARIPMVLYADGTGTLPHASKQPVPDAASTEPTGEDRATRLAAVILAWNVCQHFYPYFDVVKTDWNAALTTALTRASLDNEADVFVETLRELASSLHDGHGAAFTSRPPAFFMLPINAEFLSDQQLVVTGAGMGTEQRCSPGDSILSIAGRPVTELLAEAKRYEPASSPQHARHRVITRILSRQTRDPVAVLFHTFEGQDRTSGVRPFELKFYPHESRPDAVAELKPGIMYLDVDRVDAAALKEAMPKLEAATGIVVDVRGYPNAFPWTFLGQLTDTPVTSPQWHVPICDWPDGEKRTFQQSGWPIPPAKPRLKAKVAFITDGRAISAAETFMSIVSNAKLGEIVGGPTAGTNGNINVIDLPGGFKFVFTGMKVLRHDGSQFHGIGVLPTIPVERTPKGIHDGRDELLDKAIEVVSGALPAAAPAGGQPQQQPAPDGDKRD